MPTKAEIGKVQTAVKFVLEEHLQNIAHGHGANLEFRIVSDLWRNHSVPGPWSSMWAKN